MHDVQGCAWVDWWKNWLRENGRMHGSVVGAWVAGCEGGSGMEYYSIPKGCVSIFEIVKKIFGQEV
jgi:hypothetical protein